MKKLILIAVAVMVWASCKKDMSSNSTSQADLAVKEYSDIVSSAVISKLSADAISSNDKDKKDKDDKDKKGKQETKALKISGSGLIVYIPDGCGAGTLRFKSDGTANSSHLGLLKQKTTFCIDMATGQPTTSIGGVATTGNGDKLNYTLIGMGIDPATGFTSQTYMFTGGTGKLDDASGSMTLLYDVFTPATYSYSGKGTITIYK